MRPASANSGAEAAVACDASVKSSAGTTPELSGLNLGHHDCCRGQQGVCIASADSVTCRPDMARGAREKARGARDKIHGGYGMEFSTYVMGSHIAGGGFCTFVINDDLAVTVTDLSSLTRN